MFALNDALDSFLGCVVGALLGVMGCSSPAPVVDATPEVGTDADADADADIDEVDGDIDEVDGDIDEVDGDIDEVDGDIDEVDGDIDEATDVGPEADLEADDDADHLADASDQEEGPPGPGDCRNPEDERFGDYCYREGFVCDDTHHCEEGYDCIRWGCRCNDPGLCGLICTSDDDCQPGERDLVCATDDTCRWRLSCFRDESCRTDERCFGGICHSYGSTHTGGDCESHYDCATGSCIDSICYSSCTANGDCPADQPSCVFEYSFAMASCLSVNPCAHCDGENEACAWSDCYDMSDTCVTTSDCPLGDCVFELGWFFGSIPGVGSCQIPNSCEGDEFGVNDFWGDSEVDLSGCFVHVGCYFDSDCPESYRCRPLTTWDPGGMCGREL